jgi:hypothetical protein
MPPQSRSSSGMSLLPEPSLPPPFTPVRLREMGDAFSHAIALAPEKVDALAVVAEPETAIDIAWPDAILVNGGLVGGGRLAWPKDASEDEVPPWLVFGAMIRTASVGGAEPGANPLITTLDEEGFTDTMTNHLVESFARNFMVAVDAWQESGFGAVARRYIERLPREKGLRRDFGDNGDLLVRRIASAQAERNALMPQLREPAWYDSVNKEPRI